MATSRGRQTCCASVRMEDEAGRLKEAFFASGCLRGPPYLCFERIPGVVRVATGYSQGPSLETTAAEVRTGTTGHAIVARVAYDSAKVSYDKLLEEYTNGHDYTQLNRQGGNVGTQYRSGIYTHDEQQSAAARAHIERLNALKGGTVVTEVEAVKNYTEAEWPEPYVAATWHEREK